METLVNLLNEMKNISDSQFFFIITMSSMALVAYVVKVLSQHKKK